MKARIDQVEVFAQYGQDGFVHYIVRYCSGVKRVYRISSHFRPCAAEKHVPKSVMNFIHTAEMTSTTDRHLFDTEPAAGCKIPCGFVSSFYFKCPF